MSEHEYGTFAALDAEELYPGVVRRAFSSSQATVTAYEFRAGATFPLHRHAAEQVTLVEEGEVRFTVDGDVHVLGAGGWSVVPGGVAHGITAGSTGARILAIVSPRRGPEDGPEILEPA